MVMENTLLAIWDEHKNLLAIGLSYTIDNDKNGWTLSASGLYSPEDKSIQVMFEREENQVKVYMQVFDAIKSEILYKGTCVIKDFNVFNALGDTMAWTGMFEGVGKLLEREVLND